MPNVTDFYKDNNLYYPISSKLTVFPCAWREHGIDPEARLNSEKSLSNLGGQGGGNKKYLSITDSDLANADITIVLNGYTFTLSKVNLSELTNRITEEGQALYVGIKLEKYDVTSSKKSDKLGSFHDRSTGESEHTSNEVLDKDFDNVKYFTGLAFSLTKPENMSSYIKIYENGKFVNRNILPLNITNGKNTGSLVLNSISDFNDETTENVTNLANGDYSIASGYGTTASGDYSHAEGQYTKAEGKASHAEGGADTAQSGDQTYTIANSDFSHAEGKETNATGVGSHTEGISTTTNAQAAHAEGEDTKAFGSASHAEGQNTTAFGNYSHAEGLNTMAYGINSHAEGHGATTQTWQYQISGAAGATTYTVDTSHGAYTGGINIILLYNGRYAKVVSYTSTTITLDRSLNPNEAITNISPKRFLSGVASGDYSHAEGCNTTASHTASHAEGYITKATGAYSHSEGDTTIASGFTSHAEGLHTTASGTASHAEGYGNGVDKGIASGDYSHAEGYYTTASGAESHAEGYYTTASNECAHAEGQSTTASGKASHAEGYGTIAEGNYQHVFGKWNVKDTSSAEIVGWGNDEATRKNIRRLDTNGNENIRGKLYVGDTSNALNGSSEYQLEVDGTAGFTGSVDINSTSYMTSNSEATAIQSNGSAWLCNNYNNAAYIGLAVGSGKAFQVLCNGAVTAKQYTATSDKRLKENIIEFKPEKSILDLPVYKYNFIGESKEQIGCLAQDLQEICPEIVEENMDGYLSIQESKLVYLLLSEVKKLKEEVKELKNDIRK